VTAPVPITVTAELKAVLRRLKLGKMLDTLPERLALARQNHLPHHDFLEVVLSDEITRRDRAGAEIRARAARLDPTMVLEAWDDTAKVRFDRDLWGELTTLRFVEDAANVLILGPVGVGKTFMASALGHVACRRARSVHFERADRMLKRLKASRLDMSHEAEMRKLIRVDLLVIDDLCLQAMDPVETQDIYELVVERHRRASTVTTSNREPVEWLAVMADPLLAQSAIDRLQSAAYELVVEGESYRKRQKPTPGQTNPPGRRRRPS
jgi:DNA replication protein DnaC